MFASASLSLFTSCLSMEGRVMPAILSSPYVSKVACYDVDVSLPLSGCACTRGFVSSFIVMTLVGDDVGVEPLL